MSKKFFSSFILCDFNSTNCQQLVIYHILNNFCLANRFYVFIYSTDYYLLSCCVLVFSEKNCFINLVMLVFTKCYCLAECISSFKKCHNLPHHTTCKFYQILIDKPNARANQFFPSAGGRRIRKSFRAGCLIPFPLHTTHPSNLF